MSSFKLKTLRPAKFERYVNETNILYLPLAKDTSPYIFDKMEQTFKELKASSF